MAPISVLLGSFGVCTRGSGPSLTITSSISLALPDNWEANVSAADLFEEVEKGNLWIARAGTCSLEIIHDFNQEGTPALPQDTHRDVPRQLAAAVEHCPVSIASLTTTMTLVDTDMLSDMGQPGLEARTER